MPKEGVDMAEAINYDVEQLYEKLLKENQQNNNSSGNGEQTSDEKKQDVGHDTHSMWDDAIKKQKEEQANKNKNKNLSEKLSNRDNQEKEDKKNE